MKKCLCLGATLLFLAAATPAWGCGALIGARGSVQLSKTTTLSAYVDGKEHYITSFEFSGGGGEFGSIVPLPGIPEKIEKAGEWTLQRLIRETQPRPERRTAVLAAAAAPAQVIQETKIDALNIVVLKGGGSAVGDWARDHGFLLPPDAPEILDFYASRSPIFMAAIFDAKTAEERGQRVGDGTPIHLTIPTSNPWVPLRILTLGNQPDASIQADVYLLTERKPALLPVRAKGVELKLRQRASEALLADLHSDKGMEWLPLTGMWLSYMSINAPASGLHFDLATDVSGRGRPSYRMAGLKPPVVVQRPVDPPTPSPLPSPPSPSPSPSPRDAIADVGNVRSQSHIAWVALGMLLLVAGSSVALRLAKRGHR